MKRDNFNNSNEKKISNISVFYSTKNLRRSTLEVSCQLAQFLQYY